MGQLQSCTLSQLRLVGLVVKVSTSRSEDPGSDSHLRHGDVSWSCDTSDLKIGTPVATLPGALCYRVSAGTGCPGVSILLARQKVRSTTSISVWQHVQISEKTCRSDTLACCRDAKQATNKQPPSKTPRSGSQ